MEHAYNLICLGQEVVSSDENAIEWCQKHHLIPTTRECGNCKQPMTIRTTVVSEASDAKDVTALIQHSKLLYVEHGLRVLKQNL